MNKSRKTSNLYNVVTYDETGHLTAPAGLTLGTAPASSDNSSKAASTAWIRTYVAGQSYATSASVTSAIAALVDTAPTTLDTLNELAAALGDDPNFATTVTASIGTKVPQARTITINGTAYDLSADRTWTIAAGLTSFNTRTGAITLTSGDVTGALGYTPISSYTDTLATVTARGATTSTALTLNNTLNVSVATSQTVPVLNLTGTGTGQYQRGLRLLNNNLTANDSIMYAIGKSDTDKNMGQINFVWVGSSSTSNRMTFGFYNVDNILNVLASGNVVIGGAADVSGVKLNVIGTAQATSFVRSGGTATQFLKADGTVDANTYLTGITSANVTTALGYTPYNATNPNGYITNITSANVTTALGYTPWAAEGSWKPASLVASTRLIGKISPDGGEFALAYSGGQIHAYVDGFFYQNEGQYKVLDTATGIPITGGTMTGKLQINSSVNTVGGALQIYTTTAQQYPQIYSNGDLEAMWNYKNSNAEWYVGLRTTAQLVGNTGFHFYNTTNAQSVAGFDINGNHYALGSSRSPIFYDLNDTGYYGDFAGTSSLWGLAIRGDNGANSTSNQIFFWGAGGTTTSAIGFKSNAAPFASPTGSGDGYNTYLTMDTPGRGWVFRRGTGGTDFSAAYTAGWILNNGIAQFNSSIRAPIFYDSEDTGYYLDPSAGGSTPSLKVAGNIDLIARSASWAEGIRIRVPGSSVWGGIRFTRDRAGDDGNWGVGFTGLNATDDLTFYGTGGGSSAIKLNLTQGGTLTASGDIVAYSDKRVKTNVNTIQDALEKVMQLRGVSYNRTDVEDQTDKIGVIAQETQVVVPEVVHVQENGFLGVAYGNFAGLFIEAFKEQQSQIASQGAQITELMEIIKTMKGL